MSSEGIKRKISAILSADAVGYSKLMEADEETTVRTMESYRDTISSLIQQHNGRVVDSPGDNVLAEFPSVVESVQCAVEIQHVIKAKNAVIPEARRMDFRIGIHLGDVIEERQRIYGDGVNIAARIEGLADAGGICISNSAYEQIRSKLALGYEDIGEHAVKNISDPVRVFRIPLDSAAVGTGIRERSRKPFQWVAVAVILALLAGIGAVTLWNQNQMTQDASGTAREQGQEGEPEIVEKPSIAVLPFRNISGDPEQKYFSDGISEDILNGLAKNPGLNVIARTSSFRFRDENQDIRDIGKQLNATHILEGSVRKSGSRTRVTAKLIATDTGMHLWSEQYNRELAEMFEVQDDISEKILNAMNIHLLSTRKEAHTESHEAYDAYLMGRNFYNLERWDEATDSLKKAIQVDPNYADAHGMIALVYTWYIWYGYRSPLELVPIIRKHVEKALSLYPSQPEALIVSANISFFVDRDYQTAIYRLSSLLDEYTNSLYVFEAYRNVLISIGELHKANRIHDHWVKIDPLNPLAHSQKGTYLLLAGDMAGSIKSYERMRQLGTIQPTLVAWAAFLHGDIRNLRKQVDLGEANWGSGNNWYPIFKAAIHYIEGNSKKATETLEKLKQQKGYISYFMKTWIASLENDLDLALEYYSKALSEYEFGAYNQSQSPTALRKLHPEYRSHPKYLQMLKDVGLDEESISKLKIPPLPF